MEEIKQQVTRARRRMIAQQFMGIVAWSLFAALFVAVIGVAIPKIWFVAADQMVWLWSWFGGAVAVGLIAAGVLTYVVRRQAIDAAMEIDRRHGLKERVSSAMALGAEEQETEVGRALVTDAARRVAKVDIRESFRLSANWRILLPLAPAAAVFLIAIFVGNATKQKQAGAKDSQIATKEQIKKANEQLKKRLDEQIKNAEDKGLKDAEVILKELKEQMDKLGAKEQTNRKDAMIKLNDLKQDLEDRRAKLGGADKMRKHMEKLKSVERGPADKFASAMQDGEFGKALDELNKVKEQLEKGEMSSDDRNKLADQLSQMQKMLEDVQKAQEQAKSELQKQIQQAKAAGDTKKMQQLQSQLDSLTMQDSQMSQLNKMCDQLGQCAQALRQGDSQSMQSAANQLSQMADQLQQLQQQLDQLETLDDVLDQIAGAKDAMNCKECGGMGCAACQGGMGQFGMGGQSQRMGGMGLGAGRGQGDRPEAETDTGEYLSRVRGQLQKGEAVKSGEVGGANVSGKSMESVKEEVLSNLRAESDPLTNERLPRPERRHAKEYFERLRNGE